MKKISYLLVFFIGIFICLGSASASTSVSVKANKSSLVVGNTVTVTVTYYSSNLLAQAYGTVTYNSSVLKLTSGNLSINYFASDSPTTTKTYTYTFKAVGSGTTKVSVSGVQIYELNSSSTSALSPTPSSASITVITQEQLESSYSKNNYLSSLEVEGYNINFNKDTLEYNLEVENSVTNVNIKAAKEDSKASVSGSGVIAVSEGLNKLEVVVTAENGNTKTYTINLNVKELDPISVKVDGKSYTVIRKSDALPKASSYYILSTTNVQGNEVPCYYNETSNITLVGLKDSDGNSNLYIYSNDNYKLYNELTFNQLAINILSDDVDVPKGYNKATIKIGDSEFTAYKSDKYDFSLIYGLNLATGKKNLYKYDEAENTIQRYEEVDTTKERLYFNIIVGLLGFITISYIVFILILSSNKKKNIEKAKTKIETKEIPDEEKKEILKTMSIDIDGIKEQVKKTNEDKKISKKELKKQKK